ncbi:MAG: glycosyltransferase family 2 protein [Candidatus Omnitrophota bacterium]
MNAPQVDIIIPVYNQPELTKKCLDSIAARQDIPYRLIIIDNASSPETKKLLNDLRSSHQNVRIVINKENAGWVKAVNQGMRLSESPYICIMNNDTVVKTDKWLSGLIKVAETENTIGLVNPRFHIKKEASCGEPYVEIDFCRGYCILIKRAVMNKIGWLDEDYGMGYYDDDDYSVRAIQEGFRCVRANDIIVEHLGDSTFSAVFGDARRRDLHQKNKELFYSKWGSRLKLLFIITKDAGRKELSDTMLSLARKQHIVYMWNPKRVKCINHINVRERIVPALARSVCLYLELYLNKSRKGTKRFDMVFVEDMKPSPEMLNMGTPVFNINFEKDGKRICEMAQAASRDKHAV